MRALTSAVALTLIAGCAVSPERASTMNNLQLCLSLQRYLNGDELGPSGTAVRDEINRRELMDPKYWGAVYGKRVSIGMPVCGLYAVMGYPSVENRTATARGTSVQHVYRSMSAYGSTAYFYSENGRITAWQN